MLLPKLWTTLKGYSTSAFFSDLVAGIVVGVVAIPLAIAFAIASGVPPEKGLITAVIGGFFISFLGGSRVQIGGPTGAFVVIIYGVVYRYGIEGLIIATILAGILLVLIGVARLGVAIKFIPHPVIVGFTSGIAVIIFSSQIKDFFGLQMGIPPVEFLWKWETYLEHIFTANGYAAFISFGTVVLIALWPRLSRRVPGSLMALIVFSGLAAFFQWPVETIGSRFGELPHTFSPPQFPRFDFQLINNLIQPAFTIALLGGIESLLSAVVADGMIGGRHRSNMELIAQGVANIFSGIFGGIPATGAIARTVTNIKNGGRTPVAGIIHSLTVLAAVLFFAPLIKLIPLACLAGILVIVAYNMSEWRSFVALLKGIRSDAVVLVVTFLMTVFFDLTIAIEIGMVLSVFLFMHRMARVSKIEVIAKEIEDDEREDEAGPLPRIAVPDGVEIYEINGPFFFGVSHEFEEAVRAVAKLPKVRILKLNNVPMIDATGLHSLKAFVRKCRHDHIHLLIVGAHSQPLKAIHKGGVDVLIGRENIMAVLPAAIARAEALLHAPAPIS